MENGESENQLEYAWIETEGKLYIAACSLQESESSGRSPVIELIEQIYYTESFQFPSQARRLLRERIHTDYSPSITDRETVKVAAKRLGSKIESVPTELKNNEQTRNLKELPSRVIFSDPKLVLGDRISSAEIPDILERLRTEEGLRIGERLRQNSDRSVSALLLDRDDRILGWAWNTNETIKTQHAEWNLCEGLGSKKIPAGAKLWVSLKPCRMCAARIWEKAEDPAQIEVIYIENDPGPLAQGTMLDTDSPARRHYLGSRDVRRGLQIQKQFVVPS